MYIRKFALYLFVSPQHFEKVEDVYALNVSNATVEAVKRNDDATTLRMLFAKGFQSFQMFGLDFIGRLDFDGNTSITNDDIDLYSIVGTPI